MNSNVGLLAGSYRIKVKANGRYLHEDGLGDHLLSTRYQVDDDFTRFVLEPQSDGSYRIKVKANGRYLHEDGLGDHLLSTRYQVDDNFSKFLFVAEEALVKSLHNDPIVTVRHQKLSLWQSAVAEVARQELRAAQDDGSKPDVYNHPQVRAAALHVQAHFNRSPIAPIAPEDIDQAQYHEKSSVSPLDVHLSKRHFELAEATLNNDLVQAAAIQDEIRKFSTADWSVGPPPTGWLKCATVYAEYVKKHKSNTPTYNDWKALNKPIEIYGVINYKLPNNGKVAIIGDWGTGMDDAKQLLVRIMTDHTPDVLIHLGDIYYSGTEDECRSNFADIIDSVFNSLGTIIPVFTIPGNHDYYDLGDGYYSMLKTMLNMKEPTWYQEASYFCLRTEDDQWQFLGMDTGYNDQNLTGLSMAPGLQESEIEWHEDKLNNFKGRTILLSHHQLFSANNTMYASPLTKASRPYLNDKLLKVFQPYFLNSIAAWFWGHEHNFVLFQNSLLGLEKGRLIGASSYEETVAEDPYKVNHPEVPYLDPNKYRLDAEQGYYNHCFAILDFSSRATNNGGVKATYYQYPSWGGVKTTPPSQSQVKEIYSEILNKVPSKLGGTVNYNDRIAMIAQGAEAIIKFEKAYNANTATDEYYPRLGDSSDAIILRLVGDTGPLKHGDTVQIQTTEDGVGEYNILGAWSTPALYYYKPGYQQQDWKIYKCDTSVDEIIHYGDEVYFENQYYTYTDKKKNKRGQILAQEGTTVYLTTEKDTTFYWTFENKMPPLGPPIQYGSSLKMQTEDGNAIIKYKEAHNANTAANEYYPRVGKAKDAIDLKFVGGTGDIKDGARIQIQTTESGVGKYNQLGAWTTPDLYYYKDGWKQQNWRIHKLDTTDPVIHYGDEVYIVNEYYTNQWLTINFKDPEYLTTVSNAKSYWTLQK